jgi:hypothetical protein
MKMSSQLMEGRSHRAQPAIGLHYPGMGRMRATLQAKEKDLGDDLLFQTVASPVPSALTGLTAVFGMGTGVSPSLWSPKSFSFDRGKESSLGTAQIARSTSCANER